MAVLLGVIDGPEHPGLVGRDLVVEVAGGDLASRQERGLVTTGHVLKNKRPVLVVCYEVTVLPRLDPCDGCGGDRERARIARGNVIS